MEQDVTLIRPGYQASNLSIRSRLFLVKLFEEATSWVRKRTFSISSYTVLTGFLGINLNIANDAMRFLANSGIILGVILSLLGIGLKIIEIRKALKKKNKKHKDH